MVRVAAGINEARGDIVVVQSLEGLGASIAAAPRRRPASNPTAGQHCAAGRRGRRSTVVGALVRLGGRRPFALGACC